MSDILQQYYRGITQQLRAEVDLINSLFEHQGLKGSGNEAVLRNLLTRFLPRQYGVGSGVVIDSHEKTSRQCDIVIYDTHNYPSFLSLSSVHLFPVDLVYATIEIKTTLNATEARGALQNVQSVRGLSVLPDKFMVLRPESDRIAAGVYSPTPPLGFVFAYNSDARSFETFANWFIPQPTDKASLYPVMVASMDQGIVKFRVPPEDGATPDAFALPVLNPEGRYLQLLEPLETCDYEGTRYPVKKVNNQYVAIDPARVFMAFVVLMSEMLAIRHISPSIRFSTTYLKSAFQTPLISSEANEGHP